MSLLVHLPLMGDLRNNGLAGDVTVTSHGATVNNSGKIGKCYEFDGSDDYIEVNDIDIQTVLQNDFSIAMWIYNNDSGDRSILFGTYAIGSNVNIEKTVAEYTRFYFNGAPDIIISQASLTPTTWVHLAVVKTASKVEFYINGALVFTYTGIINSSAPAAGSKFYIGRDYRTGATAFKGLINDFRLYDHALSPREVKELSKGLVAHWKLDENINVLNNAYNYPTFDTSAAGGGWYHWGYSGHQGSYAQNTDKQYIYNKSQAYSHMISNGASASAGANYLVYQNPAFEGGYRSLQCICKEVNGAQIDESIFYPAWNARDGGVAPNKWTSITPLGDGFYLCKCEGIHQNGSNDLIGFYVTVGNTVYISEAYCEDDREVCSDIFWQDEIGTTHDSSGYCHDGTLSPTPPTFDSDSARYSGCMKFSSNYIHCGLSSLYPTDEITVAWWGYMDSWSSYGRAISCTESGGWNFEPNSGKIRFLVYKKGVGYGRALSETSLSSLSSGWHFFVGTFDGYVLKIYIDGEYENVSTDASPTVKAIIMYRANVPIYIGCEANGANPSSPYFNGKLSDIRIYATALSAEDIKGLYNTSASIDDHHNVYARELVED